MTDPSIIRFREREQRKPERARLAEQEEQRRKAQRRAPQNRDNERLSRLENAWAQFGQQVTQVRQVQMRQALMENRARVIADLERHFLPPPPRLAFVIDVCDLLA